MRHLGLFTTNGAYQILFLRSTFNIFTLLSILKYWYDAYELVSRLLELSCLNLSWGSSITYSDTQSAHGRLTLSIHTPHPFQALHFHPGECQKPSMPGQLLQEHSKASSNVTAHPRFSLRLSGVHLLWKHSTLYKSPLKSSQTTFLNTCCIIGTLCWALENIKIALRPRLYPYGSHSLVGDR